MSVPKAEIARTKDLKEDLISEIHHWLMESFINENDTTVWSSVDWHILLWVGNQLVSHAEIVEREISVRGEKVLVGGIGGVVTRPQWRHRGLASTAMEVAQSYICGELNLEFGLLMCDETVVSFYEKLGWEVVKSLLVFDQPTGKVAFEDTVMVYGCGSKIWPDGRIDVQGPPW
ncbi:MAG: GNAT family N-acetyltransferase [Chloroflexota bacterium]|nr:GNAT family N-acetyltransferase [Chloroflexota bacterium]